MKAIIKIIVALGGLLFFNACIKQESPIAQFDIANKDCTTIPCTFKFTNNSIGDDRMTYKWTFGDNTTSFEKNPQHIYSSCGTYHVLLEVSNQNGTDTASLDVNATLPKTGRLKSITIYSLPTDRPDNLGRGWDDIGRTGPDIYVNVIDVETNKSVAGSYNSFYENVCCAPYNVYPCTSFPIGWTWQNYQLDKTKTYRVDVMDYDGGSQSTDEKMGSSINFKLSDYTCTTPSLIEITKDKVHILMGIDWQ